VRLPVPALMSITGRTTAVIADRLGLRGGDTGADGRKERSGGDRPGCRWRAYDAKQLGAPLSDQPLNNGLTTLDGHGPSVPVRCSGDVGVR
jgi:hypothetical protein